MNKVDYSYLKEMGFSKEDIAKASKIATEKKVDLLDVLTKSTTSSNSNQTAQTSKPQQRLVNPFVYRPLIKPRSQIVMDEYQCIFRQNDYTSAGDVEDRREDGVPVALKNVSNCCYLNSLLQMFFLMPKFVEIVISAKPMSKEQLDLAVTNGIRNKRVYNSFALLRSLQSLYSSMILTTKKVLDPSDILRNLVDSLGNKISYGEEKDLSQISLQFISRLQECVIYTQDNAEVTHSYWESPEKEQFNSTSSISLGSKPITSPIKQLLFGDKVEICNDSDETRIESKFFGILLNPVHDSLYKALDEQFHFKVEHEGKQVRKDVWITRQPDYLFFFIQRTNYDKQLGVIKMKNRIKFDFEIYIDRYLFKNKHKEEQKNPLLLESVSRRDDINRQISQLQSLMKALCECHIHAREVRDLPIELPKTQPLQELLTTLKKSLAEAEDTIGKLESRQERYRLRFIIVHRGEADSGHYWGYGFTNRGWWRYDIHNSRVEKEQMTKEIESGDVVVYALIYGRHEEEFHPSLSLFLNDDDLLNADKNYNHFVKEELRNRILAENRQREKLNEDKKSAESISVVTLEYEERFRMVNEAVRKHNDKQPKVPYLGNFSGYLRWLGGQHPNALFKAHLLDIAIRSSTKYNIKDVPSEQYRNQLAASLKQNLSKYSCPEKFVVTKLESEKMTDRFKEYKNNLIAVNVLMKMFESISLGLPGDAVKCAHYVIQLGLRNHFENMAKEFFAVLALALTDSQEGIPASYFQIVSKIDSKLAEQLAAVVSMIPDRKEDEEYREVLDSLTRFDKIKQKELYLSTAASQVYQTTGDRLTEQIKRSIGKVGKYVKAYNRMIAASKPLRKNELLAS